MKTFIAAVIIILVIGGSGLFVNAGADKMQDINLGFYPALIGGLIVILLFIVLLIIKDLQR